MGKRFLDLLKHPPGGRWLAMLAVFVALAVADYAWLGFTRIADQRGGDLMLALHARQRPVSDRVVIVDIDQKSLEQMNDYAGKWSWPRSVHGELIDHIQKQAPRAIVFDILFNEADTYRPEHDAPFADAVARNPNVWLAMSLSPDGDGAWVSQMPGSIGARPASLPARDARVPLLMPLAVYAHPEAMRGGLINFTADSDTVGRHHALYGERSGWRFPSLPARVMESLGRPVPPQEQVLLNWRSGWKHVSYSDLYLDSMRQTPQRPAGELKDKIVVIGTAAPGLMDFRLTPVGSTYPGVEILATSLDNLDRGDWLREVPRLYLLPLALGLLVLVAVGFVRQISANRLGYTLLALTAITLAIAWLALVRGTFLPVLGALAFGWAFYLAASALAYLQERNQRLRTSTMFKRFLDPRVVADLIENSDVDYRSNVEAKEVTVMFSDIRGFTALSEVASPEDVVAMLNSYFSKQVEVIFANGGTLDKFIGDAIMAFWGAPVEGPDSARQAVDAAIGMSQALVEMRGQIGEIGKDLEIGIGIHTGRAVVGFIGSSDRLDYTVIGDTVNLASRVEGLTKGIARVLVTDATRTAVGDEHYSWRDCGMHSVKGRENQVQLFEPIPKAARLPG